MINDKDIFNKDMSPLFEAYGKACYNGQNLEQSFRFLLTLNELKNTKGKDKDKAFEKVELETALLTLNKIFRKAQEKEYFSGEQIKMLIRANQLRNYIIHEYWSKNISDVMTPDGRLRIKTELEEYARTLKAADKIIVERIDNYLIEHGLTTEILKKVVDQKYEAGSVDIPNIKH